jgi:hypothetical protein
VSKPLTDDRGVIKLIIRIVIDERESDQRHDSLVYAADSYIDCDDDIDKRRMLHIQAP